MANFVKLWQSVRDRSIDQIGQDLLLFRLVEHFVIEARIKTQRFIRRLARRMSS